MKKVQSLYGSDAVDMDTLAFKDGRIFERHSFPMIMDGAVIGRVWSFRDITERKRQEKEISEKSVELERFTYTVSHDLKSPLVTVKTFLGYLEQDLLNPDAERIKQDVGYMRTAADKMGHLLDELLNLARVGRKSNPTRASHLSGTGARGRWTGGRTHQHQRHRGAGGRCRRGFGGRPPAPGGNLAESGGECLQVHGGPAQAARRDRRRAARRGDGVFCARQRRGHRAALPGEGVQLV